MSSYWYNATIYHKRTTPTEHEFEYKGFYFNLYPLKSNSFPFFISIDRKNFISLHLSDFECKSLSNLENWVERTLELANVKLKNPITQYGIRLQSFTRVCGYGFNPVSFWYIETNGSVECIIAEVNNTFGGKQNYVIYDLESGHIQNKKIYTHEKIFHVSPFNKVEGRYDFIFHLSQTNQKVSILYKINDQLVLNTYIHGQPESAGSINFFQHFLKNSMHAFKVVCGIHFEAAKLYLKKVPFYGKNPNSKEKKT